MTALRVTVVAHDAGGTRALQPVALELLRRGATIDAIVAGPAVSIWPAEASGVRSVAVKDDVSVADALRVLHERGTTTLLSACGLYNRVEHTFRVAASAAGCRSVSVLDSWLYEPTRFERDGIRCWPDLVCAIDGGTAEALYSAGLSPDRVAITGAPNLEATVRRARGVTSDERERLREALDASPDDLVCAFLSEPFEIGPERKRIEGPGAIVGPDGRSLYGYTSSMILTDVLRALGAACARIPRKCLLVVKPHPLEYPGPLRAAVESSGITMPVTFARSTDSAMGAILAADVVFGMMSIALLEAALVDRVAVSVQIGLRESNTADPCLANALGYSIPVYDRAALVDVAQQVASRAIRRPRPGVTLENEGAASRVADAIIQLVSRWPPVSSVRGASGHARTS